jgi:hypothetical protein
MHKNSCMDDRRVESKSFIFVYSIVIENKKEILKLTEVTSK